MLSTTQRCNGKHWVQLAEQGSINLVTFPTRSVTIKFSLEASSAQFNLWKCLEIKCLPPVEALGGVQGDARTLSTNEAALPEFSPAFLQLLHLRRTAIYGDITDKSKKTNPLAHAYTLTCMRTLTHTGTNILLIAYIILIMQRL